MSAAERSLILEVNEYSALVEETLKTIHVANRGQEILQLGIIENPTKVWLWEFDFMEQNQWSLDTSNDEVWTDVDYLSCFWESVRTKEQKLRTNMLSVQQALHVEGVAGGQCHNHHLQKWEP